MKGKSWNESFASETMPTYDASKDKNNLFARKHHHTKTSSSPKKRSPKRKKRSPKPRTADRATTSPKKHSFLKPSSRTVQPSSMRSVPERMKELAEKKKNLSKTLPPIQRRRNPQQNLSITYHLASGGDQELADLELDVTKCILLRESYLEKCENVASATSERDIHDPERLVDLLDRLRMVSVETVEAIGKWRQRALSGAYAKPREYMWQGLNYMLKMAVDMDLFENCMSEKGDIILKQWLGFSLRRNPFIIPDTKLQQDIPIAKMHKNREPHAVIDSLFGDSSNNNNNKTKGGFHHVGGRRVKNDTANILSRTSPPKISQSEVEMEELTKPYETAIVNEETVKRHQARSPSRRRKQARERRHQKHMHLTRLHFNKIRPSNVGEMDMIRIQAAEKTILEEENMFGRLVREDGTNRLVPEIVKRRHVSDKRLGRVVVAAVKGGGKEEDRPPLETASTTGKQRGYKQGGELAPITKQNTMGTKQEPMSLSLTARKDAEIRDVKRLWDEATARVKRLNSEIRNTREEIESKMSLEKNKTEEDEIELKRLRHRLEKLQDEHKSAQFEENSWEREATQQEERRELIRKERAKTQSVVRTRKIRDKKREVRLDENDEEDEEEKKKAEEEKNRKRLRRMSVMSVFDNEDDDEDLEELPPEHYAAIAIQRAARRRIAARKVRERRVRFNRAALLVQMMRRKFIAKRYVRRKRQELNAAKMMQRAIRGMRGRRIVRALRERLKRKNSAMTIQCAWRTRNAVLRMNLRREFVFAKREVRRATEKTMGYDIAELLTSEPPVPIRLLHLLRAMLLLFTSPNTDAEDMTGTIQFARLCSWASLQRIVGRPAFLIAMQRLCRHAWSEKMQLSDAAIKQVGFFFLTTTTTNNNNNNNNNNTTTFRYAYIFMILHLHRKRSQQYIQEVYVQDDFFFLFRALQPCSDS